MTDPNIVILAGGISSRMKKSLEGKSISDPDLIREASEKSKSMLSIGDRSRPFLDYLLYNVQESGLVNVVIVIGERDPSIRDYYDGKGNKDNFPSLKISYAVQKIPAGRTKPLGTADALLEALKSKPEWSGKSFIVCNSDNLYSVKAMRLLLECKHPNAMIDYDRAALKFDQTRIEAFSVIRKDENKLLLDIVEKPNADEIERAKEKNGRIGVSMNIFKLSYDMILPFLESVPMHPARLEKELPSAVKMMVEKYPGSVIAIPLAEHVIDLTSQSDIPFVQEYLKKEFPNFLRSKNG